MAYKKISGKPTRGATKDIDQPIMGGFIGIGRHQVTIKDIELKDRSATIVFQNGFGETHKQNVFYLDRHGTDISYPMKMFLASASSDPDQILEIASRLIDHQESRLNQFVGTDLEIVLERTDGYRLQTTKDGVKAIYNGTEIGFAPDVSLLKLDDAYADVKRSFVNIKSYHRIGEKYESRQSFFANDPTPAKSNGADRSGNVGKESAGALPASRKFF